MNHLILTGIVATTPRFVPTEAGSVLTFRFYHYDEHAETDQTGSWVTASLFGIMADEAYTELGKGDRLTLTGKLLVRDWDNGQYSGTAVEIKVYSYKVEKKWNDNEPQAQAHSCNCGNCDRNAEVA